VTSAQDVKKAGAKNSSLCETVCHLVNILQAYEKSTVSRKPRFREEKNSLYSFDYNRYTDFCKEFFKDFQFFQDFLFFSDFGHIRCDLGIERLAENQVSAGRAKGAER